MIKSSSDVFQLAAFPQSEKCSEPRWDDTRETLCEGRVSVNVPRTLITARSNGKKEVTRLRSTNIRDLDNYHSTPFVTERQFAYNENAGALLVKGPRTQARNVFEANCFRTTHLSLLRLASSRTFDIFMPRLMPATQKWNEVFAVQTRNEKRNREENL